MRNPRTTICGILSFLAVAAAAASAMVDGNPATSPDWTAVGAGFVAMIGFIAAGDAKETK